MYAGYNILLFWLGSADTNFKIIRQINKLMIKKSKVYMIIKSSPSPFNSITLSFWSRSTRSLYRFCSNSTRFLSNSNSNRSLDSGFIVCSTWLFNCFCSHSTRSRYRVSTIQLDLYRFCFLSTRMLYHFCFHSRRSLNRVCSYSIWPLYHFVFFQLINNLVIFNPI